MIAHESASDVAGNHAPGILLLGEDGGLLAADPVACRLLGWAGAGGAGAWGELRPRLLAAGLPLDGEAGEQEARIEVAAGGASTRALLFTWCGGAGGAGVVTVRDDGAARALAADLRLAAQMRSLAQISPAVAHDLRAPINAMVLNLEVLRETIASGRGAAPGGRERQLRYVEVLKEELSRLHGGLETFLAHASPRSDRTETLDLRTLISDLASLLVPSARKQLVQVSASLPDAAVPVTVNRYLVRQALLHLGLAVLERAPREGLVQLDLEAWDGRAHLRIGLAAGDPAARPLDETAFGLVPTPGGTLAALHVARQILARDGATVAIEAPEAPEGGPLGFAIDLPASA